MTKFAALLAALVTMSAVALAQDTSAKVPAAASRPAAIAAANQADLPITRVVLFSSGVGYFEHKGTVSDDAQSTLMFKVDQINDVLKSMILTDLDGGTITSVNYTNREPLLYALKSFGVDLSGAPTMTDLVKQLRGAEVVVLAPTKVTGKILNIETRRKEIPAGGSTTILTENILNLVTDKGMTAIPMDTVSSLTLSDQRLNDELNKALELLIASHDTSRKPVEIHFAGKGKRRVQVGYIAESPIWKTSYRLSLSGEKPLLQGWAIVENTSDVDWNNVKLELVSGRPISFIQDLYTPLYLPRPVVAAELFASLRPQMYDEGIVGGKKDVAANEMASPSDGPVARRPMAAAKSGRGSGEMVPPAAPSPMMLADGKVAAAYSVGGASSGIDMAHGVESVASAGKMGELFNFTIKEPVALQRRRSAMLPIVNSNIKAEKVSIYNQSVLATNPLNGAYLVNDTDMKMLGGPVTVFDGDAYAGDARIDNLVPGDKRLLSYAIDLNMTVDPSMKTNEQVVGLKIVRGVLEVTRLQVFNQTYVIKNKAPQERTVIIEHPFVPDRKLVEPAKFEEKTPAMYRFRVKVAKDSTQEFVVKEEHTFVQSIAILGESTESLMFYAKTGQIDKKVADALAKVIDMKHGLSQAQSGLAARTAELDGIKNGQVRLRENLSKVAAQSELGKRYTDKLAKEEDEIEKLEGKVKELRQAVEQQQKALADYLKDLKVP